MNAKLKFERNEPFFGYNKALEGSGGAMYFGSVPELAIRNATLVGNVSFPTTWIKSSLPAFLRLMPDFQISPPSCRP